MDEIKNLKHQKHELLDNYLKDKFNIIDSKNEELRLLKKEYKYEKIKITKPLKAEKYKKKMEKKELVRIKNEPPKRRTLEEIGNAVTHGVGSIIGLICLILMLIKATTPFEYVASTIYGLCLTLLMLFSCLYHCFRCGSKVKRVFRRFDYSSIYLLIGGTFAPIYLLMVGGTLGIVLFIVQWVLIITGITFVAVFGPGRFRWLHFSLYFILGWSALVFIKDLVTNHFQLFIYVLSGGLAYTFGMIPFAALHKKNVSHFIWHIFVLVGAFLQWLGIYLYLL